MNYDWERHIAIERAMEAARKELRRTGLHLVGIAVENRNAAQAALICHPVKVSSVDWADVYQDILGDAKRHYDDVAGRMMEGHKDRIRELSPEVEGDEE